MNFSHLNQTLCQSVPHRAFNGSLLFKSKTLEGCDSRGDVKIPCPSFADWNHQKTWYQRILEYRSLAGYFHIMSRNCYRATQEFLHINENIFCDAADPDRDRPRSDHWSNVWSNDLKRRIFQVMKFWLMKNWCSGKANSDLNSRSLTRDVGLA